MKQCHDELLEPPEAIKDDPKKVSAWKPRVRSDVDWDVVRTGLPPITGDAVPIVHDAPERGDDEDDALESTLGAETGPLTLGLIGQPNVGKSSVSPPFIISYASLTS